MERRERDRETETARALGEAKHTLYNNPLSQTPVAHACNLATREAGIRRIEVSPDKQFVVHYPENTQHKKKKKTGEVA
jgi:hypothetical protein